MTGGAGHVYGLFLFVGFSLEVKLKGLEIRGREPADSEPLFAADEVQAGLRIDSFWGAQGFAE